MTLKSGHEVNHLTGKELEELSEGFQSRKHGLIRLDPGGWIHYSTFLNVADRIYDFKFTPNDFIIMSYPKSGSTWMQEIVWTIRNNLNFENPHRNEGMVLRSPFLELDMIFALPNFEKEPIHFERFKELCPKATPDNGMFLQMLDCQPDPRTIKTHLPLSLLPPDLLNTSKVIYVARNPMDTCISYCHYNNLMTYHSYTGGLDRFLNLFIEDKLNWNPYWSLLKEAWQRRHHPNLLFCFYDDMKKNPRENLLKVSEFLNIKLNEDQIKKLLRHTSFESMKERDAFLGEANDKSVLFNEDVRKQEGGFFRRGENGDWKTKLTVDQAERMKVWSLRHLKDFEESETFTSKWF